MLDQRIDTVIGGYRLVEQVGRGGSSIVYRAEHVRLGRTAAVKLLSPALEDAQRERFLRESRLAASLDHPSIVPVYDAGEDDGLLYIAMAYVEGSDLKQLLADEGRLPLRQALAVVSQVASALDAAHERGLVHRDVKPANILVGTSGRALLSDFGVVKELASVGMTRTGSFVGTIEYCAPEQIEGRDVDPRADQYALACVLYECLTGSAPFHRPSEVAVLNAHLHAPPPRLTKTDPKLPAGLEPVLAKALSKSPLDRYGSCGELAAAARASASGKRLRPRRLTVSLALLGLAAALGALLALALSSIVGGSGTTSTVTVVQRAPSRSPASFETLLMQSKDAPTLNDAAYFFIRRGEYTRALPFVRRALRYAATGSVTRGYATFNLGYALYQLGRCSQALPLLQNALQMEAPSQAHLIRPWISRAQTCSQGGASGPAQSRSSGVQTAPSPAQ